MKKLLTALLMGATITPAAAYTQEHMQIGQKARFSGLICMHADPAIAVLSAIGEKGERQKLTIPVGCLIGSANIVAVKKMAENAAADSGHVWSLVLITLPTGRPAFIVTSKPVYDGTPV